MEQTIERFLERLKKDGRTENTCSAYRSDLRQFFLYLRRTFPQVQNWQNVERIHTDAYFAHLHDLDRSHSTIVRKTVAIRQFYAFLGIAPPVLEDPTPAHRDEAGTGGPSLPSRAEILRLLEEPGRAQTATARRDRALLELLCDTGVRASELVQLDRTDVDWEAGAIVCGAGSKRQRRVLLSRRALEALTAYCTRERKMPAPATSVASTSREPLFLNQRGTRLTRQGVWLIVSRYAAAVGMDSLVTPRSLRRAVAAHWLQTGTDAQAVTQRLGLARLTKNPPTGQNKSLLLLDGVASQPKQTNHPEHP